MEFGFFQIFLDKKYRKNPDQIFLCSKNRKKIWMFEYNMNFEISLELHSHARMIIRVIEERDCFCKG